MTKRLQLDSNQHAFSDYSQFSKLLPYQIRIMQAKVGRRGLEPPETEANGFTDRTATNYGVPTQKRRVHDSNMQALTGQRFSRPLPHHPDTRHNMEMWLLGFEPKSSDSQSEVLTLVRQSQ